MKVARVGHDVLFSKKRGKKARHISAICWLPGLKLPAGLETDLVPTISDHVCHPVANADSCVFPGNFHSENPDILLYECYFHWPVQFDCGLSKLVSTVCEMAAQKSVFCLVSSVSNVTATAILHFSIILARSCPLASIKGSPIFWITNSELISEGFCSIQPFSDLHRFADLLISCWGIAAFGNFPAPSMVPVCVPTLPSKRRVRAVLAQDATRPARTHNDSSKIETRTRYVQHIF